MKKLFLSLITGAYYSCALAQVASVGSTDGVFDVSNLGAAAYSIPIKLPSGVAGLNPNISLNYNSQGSNGIMGMGWAISAASMITRGGTNVHFDGKASGTKGSSEDRFFLDGSRLIATSGSYGSDGTIYATDIESFRKVTASGLSTSPASTFIVEDENGWKYTYGAPAVATVVIPGTTKPLMWLLYQVEDKNANTIGYSYDVTPGEEPRITSVGYTGTSSSFPNTVVTFNYEIRPDINFSYVGGGKLTQKYRLTSLAVKGRDASGELNGIRSYTMGYYMIDGISTLSTVTEKGIETGSETFNPTRFSTGMPSSTITTTDISYLDAPDDEDEPDYMLNFVSGDYNGDGYSDLITYSRNYTASDNHWRLYIGNGSTFSPADEGPLMSVDEDMINDELERNYTASFFDWNADGKEDFIYKTLVDPSEGYPPGTYEGNTYNLLLSTGTSLEPAKKFLPSDYSGATLGYHTDFTNTTPYIGDFDGDGRTEIIVSRTFRNDTGYTKNYILGEKYVKDCTGGYTCASNIWVGSIVSVPFYSRNGAAGFAYTGSTPQPQNFVIDYDGDGKN